MREREASGHANAQADQLVHRQVFGRDCHAASSILADLLEAFQDGYVRRRVAACHQQRLHVPGVVTLQDYYPVLHGPAARALLLEFAAGHLEFPLIDPLDDGHQLLELLLCRVDADALRLLLLEDVTGAQFLHQSAFLAYFDQQFSPHFFVSSFLAPAFAVGFAALVLIPKTLGWPQ